MIHLRIIWLALITAGVFPAVALAQVSESVEVVATIEAPRVLSVEADPVEFGEIAVPENAGSICTYMLSTTPFVGGATLDDPNPEPTVCKFNSATTDLALEVTCEAQTEFNFQLTYETDPAAQDANVTLLGGAPRSLSSDLRTEISGTEFCSTAAFIVFNPRTALRVPGTANSYEGRVGTININLNY